MRVFTLLEAVIDVRWARFDRENRRDASLLAKDFMVDRVRIRNFSVKETYSRPATEV